MLGDLSKLIEQGYVTDKYTHETPSGSYSFTLKTLNPSEEVDCFKAVGKYDMDQEKSINLTIEFLARAIQTVNEIELEKVPGAEGSDSLEKRRSILKKLSGPLILGLWAKYQEMNKTATPTGSEEEQEQIKK